MARTVEEPLTPEELAHLREEFWLNLVGWVEDRREDLDLDRRISYNQAKEIMDLITAAMHFVERDFLINPHQYSDILGAEGAFFREILDEAGAYPILQV